MKKQLIFTWFILLSAIISGQTPQKFSYQAVVRDTSGNILANRDVSILMTIRDSIPAGTDIYHETHDVTTNQYGMVALKIGGGSNPDTIFSAINWGSGDKFLEIQLDTDGPAGGYAWTYLGTTQLLSVPYALYAENANVPGVPGPQGPQGPAGPVAGTNGQVIYNNDGQAGGATGLYYDDTNNRVGIGTNAPSEKLEVNGLVKGSAGFLGPVFLYSIPGMDFGTTGVFYYDLAPGSRIDLSFAGNPGSYGSATMHGGINFDNASDVTYSQMRFIIYGCANNAVHSQQAEYFTVQSYHYIDGYVNVTSAINYQHATDGIRGYRFIYTPWFNGPSNPDAPHFAFITDSDNTYSLRISRIYIQFR